MLPFYHPKSGTLLLSSKLTDPELRHRLEWCGVPSEWGFSFCRTAGCHRCRQHRVAAWIQDACENLANSREHDLRFVTVMLQPVAAIEKVKPEIDRAKVVWRNLVYRLRKQDPRANALRLVGAAEVDWYSASHVHRLSGYKLDQLASLGFDRTSEEVWFPHFHLIADLAGLPERKFTEALCRQWSGHRQAQVKDLDFIRRKEDNVFNLLNYTAKDKQFYKIDPYKSPKYVPWSDSARVRYYNMVFKSGGFSLLRFHLKPTKNHLALDAKGTLMTNREPMPIAW